MLGGMFDRSLRLSLLLTLSILVGCEPRGRAQRSPRPGPAEAPRRGETLTGRVVGISDGDTLKVLTSDQQEVKVRLGGIDTPEKAQPFGKVAKQVLSDAAFGREATVEVLARDRYGRVVGRVVVAGRDLNLMQLQEGMAWYYAQYERDLPADLRTPYREAEARARGEGRGLWQDPTPTPPWEWRQSKRNREVP